MKYLKPSKERKLDTVLENLVTKYPISVENVADLSDEEFAKSRFNDFGASDSSVLLRVAYSSAKVPMKTVEELLTDKIQENWNEEISKKASVRKGKELEPLLIEKAEKLLGCKILKPRHTYANGRGLSTNFDGVGFLFPSNYVEDAPIPTNQLKPFPCEIKVCTVWGRKNYNWDKGASEFNGVNPESLMSLVYTELPTRLPIQRKIEERAKEVGIPTYYYTQVQQQIAFNDSDHGWLFVMNDNDWELFTFYVPRDQETIDALDSEAFFQYMRLCNAKGIKLELPDDGEEI